MSHFTVLVMGKDLNDPEKLEDVLQPFHEYECTGCKDQYVKHVDKTEEYNEAYLASTERRKKLPDGRLIDPYSKANEEFQRRPTDEELEQIKNHRFEGSYSTKGSEYFVVEWPEGTEDVKIPTSEITPIGEWLEDYYGCRPLRSDEIAELEVKGVEPEESFAVVKDGKLVRATNFTNPNSKWDWWVLGGRWQGAFKIKPGMEVFGAVGDLGTFGTINGDKKVDFDLVRKDALDFDTMKREAVQGRRDSWIKTFDKMRAVQADLTEERADQIRFELLKLWNHYQTLLKEDKLDLGGKHLWEYVKDEIPENLSLHMDSILHWFSSAVSDTGDYEKIEDWIQAAPAISSYAMLVDGEWIGKGEMGWFGMSSGDENPVAWEARVEQVIEALPDDHYIACVDCHI